MPTPNTWSTPGAPASVAVSSKDARNRPAAELRPVLLQQRRRARDRGCGEAVAGDGRDAAVFIHYLDLIACGRDHAVGERPGVAVGAARRAGLVDADREQEPVLVGAVRAHEGLGELPGEAVLPVVVGDGLDHEPIRLTHRVHGGALVGGDLPAHAAVQRQHAHERALVHRVAQRGRDQAGVGVAALGYRPRAARGLPGTGPRRTIFSASSVASGASPCGPVPFRAASAMDATSVP